MLAGDMASSLLRLISEYFCVTSLCSSLSTCFVSLYVFALSRATFKLVVIKSTRIEPGHVAGTIICPVGLIIMGPLSLEGELIIKVCSSNLQSWKLTIPQRVRNPPVSQAIPLGTCSATDSPARPSSLSSDATHSIPLESLAWTSDA